MKPLNTKVCLIEAIHNLTDYINGKFVPKPMCAYYGLCDNVLPSDLNVLVLISTWHENGSLFACFPVEEDIKAYCDNYKKNDRRTAYGKKRLRLAEYLRTNLIEELGEYHA